MLAEEHLNGFGKAAFDVLAGLGLDMAQGGLNLRWEIGGDIDFARLVNSAGWGSAGSFLGNRRRIAVVCLLFVKQGGEFVLRHEIS